MTTTTGPGQGLHLYNIMIASQTSIEELIVPGLWGYLLGYYSMNGTCKRTELGYVYYIAD